MKMKIIGSLTTILISSNLLAISAIEDYEKPEVPTVVNSVVAKSDLYFNPLIHSARAQESGGERYAIDTYRDGVGAYVVSAPNKDKYYNKEMNTLVFKYGEEAKKNKVSLDSLIINKMTPDTKNINHTESEYAIELRDRLNKTQECPEDYNLIYGKCYLKNKVIPAEMDVTYTCPTDFVKSSDFETNFTFTACKNKDFDKLSEENDLKAKYFSPKIIDHIDYFCIEGELINGNNCVLDSSN